jgi:large subunit ribosomal protein L10
MSRADKSKAVAELAEKFRSSSGAVLTEYRGLSVANLRDLRSSLRGNADYVVVKNTLTRIAAGESGVDGIQAFDDLLVGPSAIVFITGDAVEASKGLKNFGKDHPQLVVKGGYLDGKPLSPEEIKKLADLESREVLLAKLAGAMKASQSGAAALFAAPLAKAARTVEALRAKAEADPGVLGAGAADGESAQTSADSESADAEAPAEAQQEG